MQNKRGMKLTILVVLGLLLLGITVPVMAGTAGSDLSATASQTLDAVRNTFRGGVQGKPGIQAHKALTAEELQKLQADHEAKLQEMLSSGKITQEQYDQMKLCEAVNQAFQKKVIAAKDELSKLTGTDRQTKMQELRTQALNELLAAGTITQAQFDAFANSRGCGFYGPHRSKGVNGADNNGKMDPTARLDQLLKAGKLTQADYDALVALEAKMAQHKDELKDLKPADRQTKMKELRTQALNELLTAGTITQAQFDQLSQTPGPGGMGRPDMGGRGHGRQNKGNHQ